MDNEAGILNGRRDMPLTQRGRDQAVRAGQEMLEKEISYIYCTPLVRGLETATIIRRTLALEAARQIVHHRLIERDFGEFTGKPYAAIRQRCAPEHMLETEHVTYFLQGEGVESFEATYQRAKEFLDEVEFKHRNHNIAVVCHGDIGNMIRGVFHGWTWRQALLNGKFDNCGIHRLPEVEQVK